MISSLFLLDLICTFAGVFLLQSRQLNQKFLSISGGLMIGIALVWILPDMGETMGIGIAALHAACAIGIFFLIDRYVAPVCPCCSHRHDFSTSSLWLLATAIGIHNFFDGWMAAVSQETAKSLESGLLTGLLVHKVPEAFLFGMMLRTASKTKAVAILCTSITSCSLWLGALAQGKIFPASISLMMNVSLSLACGSFLFVGLHAFLRQRRHSGIAIAVLSVAAGVASTFVLHGVAQWLMA